MQAAGGSGFILVNTDRDEPLFPMMADAQHSTKKGTHTMVIRSVMVTVSFVEAVATALGVSSSLSVECRSRPTASSSPGEASTIWDDAYAAWVQAMELDHQRLRQVMDSPATALRARGSALSADEESKRAVLLRRAYRPVVGLMKPSLLRLLSEIHSH